MLNLTRPEGFAPDDLKLTRRGVAAAALGGYAVAALSAEAQPVVTPAEGLETGEAVFTAPDGAEIPVYVARPAGAGPHPVVLVASEIFGVHAYIEDVCRRLARQGYAAAAPHFFHRAGDPSTLTDFDAVRAIVAKAGHEQVMGDVKGVLDWLGAQPWADLERVGITGFCWGGTVVWMACARFAAFDAGVAWYGRLVAPAEAEPGRAWPVDVAAELNCPVLGLYGGADQGIPLADVEAMRGALARAGRDDSEIVVYPDAPHAFHADYRPSYRAGPAQDGWERLTAFFAERLKA